MIEKNYLIVLGVVILIAFAGFVSVQKQSVTGLVAPGSSVQKPLLSGAKSEEWYKVEVLDHIEDFFNTKEFIYPQENSCARIIEDTCAQLRQMKTSKMSTFAAGNHDSYKLILFEVPREILGKITLIRGVESPNARQLYLKIDKTIFTIRGWYEKIELDVQLKGNIINDSIIWRSGNITAEDFECSFGG